MALTVADTDVLIDALRGREPARSRIEELLVAGRLATTAITEFELLSGAGSDAARTAVDRLLTPLDVLALDTEAARQAAEIRRELEGEGAPIGMADYLIAGICRARSAAILTRNTAHFGRIHGLTLVPLGAARTTSHQQRQYSPSAWPQASAASRSTSTPEARPRIST